MKESVTDKLVKVDTHIEELSSIVAQCDIKVQRLEIEKKKAAAAKKFKEASKAQADIKDAQLEQEAAQN